MTQVTKTIEVTVKDPCDDSNLVSIDGSWNFERTYFVANSGAMKLDLAENFSVSPSFCDSGLLCLKSSFADSAFDCSDIGNDLVYFELGIAFYPLEQEYTLVVERSQSQQTISIIVHVNYFCFTEQTVAPNPTAQTSFAYTQGETTLLISLAELFFNSEPECLLFLQVENEEFFNAPFTTSDSDVSVEHLEAEVDPDIARAYQTVVTARAESGLTAEVVIKVTVVDPCH